MVCGTALGNTVTLGPPVKVGGWLIGKIVILKVWDALVLTPLLAVPPSSRATMVMVAVPITSFAGVKVSVPELSTAGALENRPGLLLPVIRKLTTCGIAFSLGLPGPAEIFVT